MGADHGGDLLHGLDLGAHDVGAPLSQHGGNDVELPAVEDIAQLFAIEPGASSALGGELDNEAIEVAGLVGGEFAFVLETVALLVVIAAAIYGTGRMVSAGERLQERVIAGV